MKSDVERIKTGTTGPTAGFRVYSDEPSGFIKEEVFLSS